MDAGSSYFGCSNEIKNMSDAVKIANMVMTSIGGSLFRERVSHPR